jgi:hypothetical protein
VSNGGEFQANLEADIIKNCPVTVKDVNIAEKIFGPDIGALKGKTNKKASSNCQE